MARWPPPLPPDGAHSFGHDAIALSFFVACVAATVALVSSMCSACGRKPKADSQAPATTSDLKSAMGSVTDGDHTEGLQSGSEEKVVTLSPDLATHGPIAPVALPASTSKRRLSMSLSMNIPDKMRLSMNIPDKMRLSMNIPDKMRLSRRERRDKVEPEDTLWKKAIILGEKCKIPGERDGEGDADADELAAGSFRRSSYSRPMSRSSSFAVHQHDPPASHSSHS